MAFVDADEIGATAAVEPGTTDFAARVDPASVVVVDLPGAESVHVGIALADRGFHPVPLFNGTTGPSALIDTQPIMRALVQGAERLRDRPIPPMAPPAFLLDSRRRGASQAASPGAYDNRWITIPQDFPSGALLTSRGLRSITLVQRDTLAIQEDLAHVLRRWQDHGMSLRIVDIATGRTAENVTVPRPSRFKRAWYAAMALFGFRRGDVGGFGSQIPEEGGRGGYG